jgi:hypothetical protein
MRLVISGLDRIVTLVAVRAALAQRERLVVFFVSKNEKGDSRAGCDQAKPTDDEAGQA